jgi:hypothetical protein
MYIGCELTHVYNADDACKALAQEKFDVAQLDHDLEGVYEYNPNHPNTGQVVAEFIVDLPPSQHPKKIIIHSWNYVGATSMRAALSMSGITSEYIPFK